MPALLPAIAAALCLGIASTETGLWLPPWVAIGAAFGALTAGLVWRRSARRAVGCAVLAALLAGFSSMSSQRGQALHGRPERPLNEVVQATVCAHRGDPVWLQIDLCDGWTFGAEGAGEPLPRRVRLYVAREDDGEGALGALRNGDRIRASLQLRPPGGLRNPGGVDRASRLTRQGVGAVASLRDPSLWVRIGAGPQPGRFDDLAELRRRVAARLHEEGPGGSLLAALALGDRSGLDAAVRQAFVRLGLAHLLAISGLHVALVAAGAYEVARRLLRRVPRVARRRDPRRPALLAGWVAAGAYALLAGWGVPARRAFLLLSVVAAGALARRQTGGAQALALAAIVVLLASPEALFELGAQLSFVATGALMFAARLPAGGAMGQARIVGRLGSIFDGSTVALAACGPLLAFHGLPDGGVGLAANLVAIPWTAFVLLPCAMGAAVAAVTPLGVLGEGWISLAATAGEVSLSGVEIAAAWLPPPPLTRAPSLPAGLAAVGIGAAVVLWARRRRWRLALVLLQLAMLRCLPPASLSPEPPRVVSLDVGLGDATLVQGREAAILVDAGRALAGRFDLGRSAVLPALTALGVDRLALLVVTHSDLDHRGGVPAVLSALSVGEVWLPPGGLEDPALEEIRVAARRSATPIHERARGDLAHFRGLRVEVLAPAGQTVGSSNDRSLVLLVSLAGRRVLLTGDIGLEAEQWLMASRPSLRADLLKVAHHGSAGSSGAALLAAVAPQLALLSAPCAPGRPLPSAQALDRLRTAGIPLAWTGRDGAVIVGLGSPIIQVRRWAAVRSCELPAGFDGSREFRR